MFFRLFGRNANHDYSHCDLSTKSSAKFKCILYATGFLDINGGFGRIGETFIEGYGEVNKFMGVF
jgi:hypothetical protein